MITSKFFAIFIFAALFVAACSESSSTVNTPTSNTVANRNAASQSTPAGTPQITEVTRAQNQSGSSTGKEIFAINCMICHKDDGRGGKRKLEGKTINAADLTSDKFKKATDGKLVAYVTDGEPDEGMPAFKGKLTDSEISAVVAHIRDLQK